MKLPAGTDGGTIYNPQHDPIFEKMAAFRGAVEIRTPSGIGFILVEQGKMLAALFRAVTDSYVGRTALSFMTIGQDDAAAVQMVHFRRYNDTEFARALDICRDSQLLIGCEDTPSLAAALSQNKTAEKNRETSGILPAFLDQTKLKKILIQPGVIAVSAFFEGFPVQSMGDADFEHVAALAEDFMRTGIKIAEDMSAGQLEQMILETAENKFIIVPCGDLFLCVFTTADTQLGLIRVILKSIQSESYC